MAPSGQEEDHTLDEDLLDSQLPEQDIYDTGLSRDSCFTFPSTRSDGGVVPGPQDTSNITSGNGVLTTESEESANTAVTDKAPGAGLRGTLSIVQDPVLPSDGSANPDLETLATSSTDKNNVQQLAGVAHARADSHQLSEDLFRTMDDMEPTNADAVRTASSSIKAEPTEIKEEPEEEGQRTDGTNKALLWWTNTADEPIVIDDENDDEDDDIIFVGTGLSPQAAQHSSDSNLLRQPRVEDSTPELQSDDAPHLERGVFSPNTDATQLDDQAAHHEEYSVVAESGAQVDTAMQDADLDDHPTTAPGGSSSVLNRLSPGAALNLGQSILKAPSGNPQNPALRERLLQAQRALKAQYDAKRNGGGDLGRAAVVQPRVEPLSFHRREVPLHDAEVLRGEAAAAEFAAAKKKYERRLKTGKNSMEEDIEFMRLRSAEDERLRRIAQDREAELMDDPLFEPAGTEGEMPSARDADTVHGNGDDDVDMEDEGVEIEGVDETLPPIKRRKPAVTRNVTKNRVPKNVEFESMQVALDEELHGSSRKKSKNAEKTGSSKKSGRGRPKSSADKAKDPRSRVAKKTGKRSKQPNLLDVSSLITGNVARDAEGNETRPAQPTFTEKRKDDALKQLVASLPSNVLRTAQIDKNYLLSASKDFIGVGSVKADGTGGWLVKGMLSSLKHYQLLGAAFFRRRERGDDKPKGGLCADQMGLGKTVMMLANVINDRRPKDKHPRTTLIVATPALASQWFSEIDKHCDKKFTGQVLKHYGKNKLATNDTAETMQTFDIVITTYSEVMRSYPKADVPLHLQTAEEKQAWWCEYRKKHQGVLHQISFHRIVLDEAQAIKNHKSHTSIACRALMGEHKWALSGTPIQNGTDELYPYFKFLRVPNTGSLRVFKENFCGNDPVKVQRLHTFLSRFMIRRTHLDRLFGAPLLQLPRTTERLHAFHFNDFERSVYEIVRRRVIMRINTFARKNELERNYQNVLTMILRLRQLTGSILNIELVMRDLLEREDHEKLAELAEVEADARHTDDRRAQLVQLRKVLSAHPSNEASDGAQAETEEPTAGPSKTTPPPEAADSQSSHDDPAPDVGGSFGLKFDFRSYLQSLRQGDKWEELQRRTLCCSCSDIPTDPWVTSCYHIYCKGCLEQHQLNAAQRGDDQARCQECGDIFYSCKPCDGFNLATGSPNSSESISPDSESELSGRRRPNKDPEEGAMKDWIELGGTEMLPSAKTVAIKAQILEWFKEKPDGKIIIYTQFNSMIRILHRICEIEDWGHETYYGKINQTAREKALEVFTKDPSCRILLAGLKVGGIGLNLTMASKVIIVDPWWNNAVEQQALCRVFRIGQKEETCMVRFVVKGTIDEQLIRIQDRKQKEIDQIMEDGGTKRRKLSIKELLRLFGPVEEEEVGEGHRQFVIVEDVHRDLMVGAETDDEGLGDEP